VDRIKRFCQPILQVLATGYILMFFSEHIFWARIRPDDTLGGWVLTWLAYSLAAFVLLWSIQISQARSFWPIFLAGAIFGWLLEGVIVQTTYEDLPLSISFTGLAWHALISVCIGWHTMRLAIRKGIWTTTLISALIGLCYGLWAISWWLEPDGGVADFESFALFSGITTSLVIVAYWIEAKAGNRPFQPPKSLVFLVLLVFILVYGIVVIPSVGLPSAVLPVLIGIAAYGLLGYRRMPTSEKMDSIETRQTSPRNLLGLIALPIVAGLVYWLALSLNLHWNTNWVLYLISTPLGLILFILSIVKSRSRKFAQNDTRILG
jgi:hypothetical protein